MLSNDAQDIIFRTARSHSNWQDKDVTNEKLMQLYELMKWGPTSANCLPGRFLFLRSDQAKQRLKPCLAEGNITKSMTAPVVIVFAMDLEFYEHLPVLFPHTDAKSWFEGNETKIQETAKRDSTLQAAYMLIAARSLGLDCGPMSGFDNEKLDAEFFPDGKVKSNFICALGYGITEKLHPRGPRLSFSETCEIQ